MSAPPKKAGGLSLYADLLEPAKQKQEGSSTISSAPVKYDIQRNNSVGDDESQQRRKDASLKFQPIKRPQVPQKTKPKAYSSSSSAHKFSSSTVTAATASSPDKQQPLLSSTPAQPQPGLQKTNFADWVGDEEDDFFYQDNRARGGRKKKNKKNKPQERTWDWDDIYDPTLPNNYADYKGSEEQSREIRDWKARLYYHQLKESRKASSNDDEDEPRPRATNTMFAPPTTMSFAPPNFDDPPSRTSIEDDDEYYPPPNDGSSPAKAHDPPPSFAPASVPDDATGEDAYKRRMQIHVPAAQSPSALAESTPPPPPPPPPSAPQNTDADLATKRAEAQAKIAAFKAKLQKQAPQSSSTSPAPPPPPPAAVDPPVIDAYVSSPPPPPPAESGSTISRAPVRYDVPPTTADATEQGRDTAMPDADGNTSSDDQPRSNRPGQKGFAERLLKKYGWEKGHGLGAQGEGITTALVAKADKRKKRQDDPARGRGAPPPNMGKIVGGKKRKVADDAAATAEGDDPRYGKMSEVIKLEAMLDGLDVQHEIEENNLMQEIGEHMGGSYGNVERVFIWREAMGGMNEVFVKFTSPLSALNAVNGMGGTEFAGNEVRARFWEVERFERGEYA